ncbi:MAG: hypothetical protein M3R49_02850 [Chloroflexota bacterium]|nr:hypothetical protein [Chloroflexota bacterium]
MDCNACGDGVGPIVGLAAIEASAARVDGRAVAAGAAVPHAVVQSINAAAAMTLTMPIPTRPDTPRERGTDRSQR